MTHKYYANYNWALNDCPQGGYQNDELCEMVADKTVIYLKNLNKKPYSITPVSAFLLSGMTQYINSFSVDKINVLDFGGACGAHYFEIRRFLPENISLNWNVVETPKMVLSAQKSNLETNELHFFSSIDYINVEIDFLHSSSTMQYVSDPYQVLDRFLKLKAKWLFFNRMVFNENDYDFITIQNSLLSANGPGPLPRGFSDRIVAYPHTTMSFSKFNNEIIKEYNLEWIFEELKGNFKINNDNVIARGLLYILKSE